MSSPPIRSLYRSLLRESNRLPYDYLRAFFRIKFRDDVAAAVRSLSCPASYVRRTKKLKQELTKLTAANAGNRAAFTRLLELAYGRRGKLKWEFREPFLTQNVGERPKPIIRGVEKSRPPVYNPELQALIISSIAHTAKVPRRIAHLTNPPTLPSRADPSSNEARLLGPFSKRREVNIRWRFFTAETRRVLPPLEVQVDEATQIQSGEADSQTSNSQCPGFIQGGLQDLGIMDMLEGMAMGPSQTKETRRERRSLHHQGATSQKEDSLVQLDIPPLPTRFLRRTHQALLAKMPILKASTSKPSAFSVSLSSRALIPKRHVPPPTVLSEGSHLAWIQKAKLSASRRK